MLEFIRHIDYSIFLFFNNLAKDSFWIKLLVFICAKYLIFFFFLIIAYMWWLNKPNKKEEHKSKRAVIYTMLSLAWAFLIDQLINLVFIRNRPYISHQDVKQLSVTVDPTSFPSAHSIFVFAIAASFYFTGYRRLGIFLSVLAAIVGLSRIAAGVHYPSDIIAGSIFGIFAAWLVQREGGWVKNNLLRQFQDKKN
ncbi:MAG: phosphatase PAP2 family protein [Candidatus Berkelbacteria bacterium]|nr:phosphatase PAP2 family protein [Candidatus Berkelbacteria bacterium]